MEVGVYGLGRFGSFWAALLAEHFPVRACSRSAERETPRGVVRVSEREITDVSVLFLCVAISALREVLQNLRATLRPGTVLMDTCSIKMYPARLMDEIAPGSVEIVATHPMFGPDSARNGVAGLPLVMWPVRAGDETVAYWKSFFTSLGLRVVEMPPEDHDREAAFTQGVTHYIGRVVSDMQLRESPIGTLGYRKLLEITEQTCNDPWQLFLDLQRYNPYTKTMRRMLHESLERIMQRLNSSHDRATEVGDG